MTKFLLINWQAFAYEMMELGRINFLTGANGTGKSSIVDAMQLILLADTSGQYFNKAANEKGDRTLAGYLRGELGDNDEDGGYNCLRTGRFTSYICAEFHDTRQHKHLTVGCCFDHYSEHDIQHQFFLFDGPMPEERFVDGGKIPWDRQQLRRWMESSYPQENRRKTTPYGKEFRGVLYAKLGSIPPKFADLLKRAVPFKAINDIEDFITEFVCTDEKTVEVLPMLDNINSYRELEKEAETLGNRVAELAKISDSYGRYCNYCEQEQLYSYLVDRAELTIATRDQVLNNVQIEQKKQEIESQINTAGGWKTKEKLLSDERTSKQTDILNDAATRTIERLNSDMHECESMIDNTTKRFELSVNQFKRVTYDWVKKIHVLCNAGEEPLHIGEEPQRELEALRQSARNLEKLAMSLIGDYSAVALQRCNATTLGQMATAAQALTSRAFAFEERLSSEQRSIVERLAKLKEEQRHLQNGLISFPENVERLRQLIQGDLQANYGLEVQVPIFAELLEIPNRCWQNAIEGYLNTQRYNILVEARHYRQALKLYNEQGPFNRLYGVGLVNVAKLLERPRTTCAGSLAEEVDTQGNTIAQAYVNFLLGRVMKCNTVDELDQHQIAITQSCMLYKNYVARLIDPNIYEPNIIGKEAIKKRLASVTLEIARLTELVRGVEQQKQTIAQFSLSVLSDTDIATLLDSAAQYLNLPQLESRLVQYRVERDAVDNSHLEVLRASVDELNTRIKACIDGMIAAEKLATKLEGEIETHKKTVDLLEQTIRNCTQRIAISYATKWVNETGNVKFEYESSIKSRPEEIKNNFSRSLAGAITQRGNEWQTLRDYRMGYISIYKVGFDPDAQENTEFDKLLDELNTVQLPSYLVRIEETRKKAYERFQDDFISRLRENIKNVEAQIDDINDAIKINFSKDRYRFRVHPNKDYQHFHRMFMDDMLMIGGFSLFSSQFNEKYKAELDELFGLITAPGEDFDKRIKTLTDYKTYLTFDMEVSDSDGITQRLSKTLNKKSGGETQNPFYITILASFAQMYRIGRDKDEKTIRLIIFDEAFSKMDGERIASSISLLRRFGFQVILSAPPEKSGDIATLVDNNLCVLKKNGAAFIRSFKPHQVGEIADGQ